MKNLLSLLAILFCMVTFTGCNDDPTTEATPVEVTVAPRMVSNPIGISSGMCLKVTFDKTGEVRYILPDDILGFDYVEGYTYRLKIKEMHVAGSNSVYYVMTELISKTPENNPDVPIKPQGL
ncbi:MAG: DUF4377 domain-containing protein [Muribaculaceae bacterium]|nr:DUF4377 domain-containing protein [Muribaculaceae bacterium]